MSFVRCHAGQGNARGCAQAGLSGPGGADVCQTTGMDAELLHAVPSGFRRSTDELATGPAPCGGLYIVCGKY
jgi:hypothetical protein